MSEPSRMTVGELLDQIEPFTPDTEITFGSSTYSKRPLVFGRFKVYGDDVLLIELCEIGEGDQPTPEFKDRITVGRLRDQMSGWKRTDFIDFGCTIDAVPLNLASVTNTVSFNFTQEEPTNWQYINKDWE